MKVLLFIIVFAIVITAAVFIRLEVSGSFIVTVVAALILRGIYNALFHGEE